MDSNQVFTPTHYETQIYCIYYSLLLTFLYLLFSVAVLAFYCLVWTFLYFIFTMDIFVYEVTYILDILIV